jgi:hypothetical protein
MVAPKISRPPVAAPAIQAYATENDEYVVDGYSQYLPDMPVFSSTSQLFEVADCCRRSGEFAVAHFLIATTASVPFGGEHGGGVDREPATMVG